MDDTSLQPGRRNHDTRRRASSAVSPQASSAETHPSPFIASHDRLEHLPPALGAVDIPWPQHHPLAVTKLIEAEQGMITHTLKVAVIGCPFLLSIDRALRAVHVQEERGSDLAIQHFPPPRIDLP